jgi:hypothetical protein
MKEIVWRKHARFSYVDRGEGKNKMAAFLRATNASPPEQDGREIENKRPSGMITDEKLISSICAFLCYFVPTDIIKQQGNAAGKVCTGHGVRVRFFFCFLLLPSSICQWNEAG